MSHDFSDKHGGRGSSCNQNNHIMSYGNSKEKWSDCSVKDFKAWHLRMKDRWCMESKYGREYLMSFYLEVRLLVLLLSYGVQWESPGQRLAR